MTDTILITGASRGIGFALTQQLVLKGHRVIATSRVESIKELQELAVTAGGRLDVQPLDVTDDASVGSLVSYLTAQCPTLDVLINNAAIFIDRPNQSIENLQLEQLVQTFETNVVGPARVTKALWPFLIHGRSPRVINISSGAGLISSKRNSNYYAYSISKAALNMFTRLLEAEAKAQSICVVAVTPGRVRTRIGDADAPLTPEESARSLAGLVETINVSDMGRFLDRDGQPCFVGQFQDAGGRTCYIGW